MCEANVYLAAEDDGRDILILESVDQIIPDGPNSWRLVSIFGEQKILEGRIKFMSLVDHRVVFEATGERPAETPGSN